MMRELFMALPRRIDFAVQQGGPLTEEEIAVLEAAIAEAKKKPREWTINEVRIRDDRSQWQYWNPVSNSWLLIDKNSQLGRIISWAIEIEQEKIDLEDFGIFTEEEHD